MHPARPRRWVNGHAVGVAVALALLTTACTGDAPTSKAKASPTPAAPTASSCPDAKPAKPAVWPAEVPDDIPKPASAVIEKVEKTSSGVTVVRFSTESSLREGVLYVVKEFPKVGYTLGRGDAEVTEADAPFQKGTIRGLVRMLAQEQCRTLWLLAIGREGGGPAPFAPRSPSNGASPLPFG
ncbi:MAG TPA: hypothetical protein VNA14_12455 [Mycobacteriales bacterium]|nr:hypothetical protein [Mycobacteriales bacterium]